MTLSPNVLWAQTKDAVLLTVELPQSQDTVVDLKDNALTIAGKKNGNDYECTVNFYKPVKEAERIPGNDRFLRFKFPKVEEEKWPTLNSDGKKHWVKIDWDHWVDSDAEDDEPSRNDDFDMPNFGFPGMGPGGFGNFKTGFEDIDRELARDYENEFGDDGDDDDQPECCPQDHGECDQCDCNHLCKCAAECKCEECSCESACNCTSECLLEEGANAEETEEAEKAENNEEGEKAENTEEGKKDEKAVTSACDCCENCSCGDNCQCTPENKCNESCKCPSNVEAAA